MSKNTKVMLWGLKKATEEMISKQTPDEKNIKEEKPKKEKKSTKKEAKIRDFFRPTEQYTIDDIKFLEDELEKLNEDYENSNFDRLNDKDIQKYYDIKNLDSLDDDEKVDIIGKMIDKVENLIEVLNDYQTHGQGIKEEESDEEKPKKDKKVKESTGKPVGRPKAQEIPKVASKARVEKGSEEAKERMRKLTEAKKAKQALRKEELENQKNQLKQQKEAEKAKLKQEKEAKSNAKKKPYYYMGTPPKGYRPATEDEAIVNEKVGEYGYHVVNKKKYDYYEKYNLLVSTDKTLNQVVTAIKTLPKRIQGVFVDIEIAEHKLEGFKNNSEIERLYEQYKKRKSQNRVYEVKELKKKIKELQNPEYEKYLEDGVKNKKKELKDLEKIFRFNQKLYSHMTNTELPPKTTFKPTVKEQVETKKTIVHEVPKTKTQVSSFNELYKGPKLNETVSFKNDTNTIEIPRKVFDSNMILQPKYAKKLHDRGILLEPKYYTKEDQEHYFYSQNLSGGSIVNRKPSELHNEIIQSVVFERPKWTKSKAVEWLKKNKFYHDSIDVKPTQIRCRQYNPEDLINRHYISKKLKDTGILLIISMRNLQGGTIYRTIMQHIPYSHERQQMMYQHFLNTHRMNGSAIMVNNQVHYTPTEQFEHNAKLYAEHLYNQNKNLKKIDEEKEAILNRAKKATKTRLKKGTPEMKERMARLRAMKKK